MRHHYRMEMVCYSSPPSLCELIYHSLGALLEFCAQTLSMNIIAIRIRVALQRFGKYVVMFIFLKLFGF